MSISVTVRPTAPTASLRGKGPAALYDRAAERVSRHLDATRRLSGWLPMARL